MIKRNLIIAAFISTCLFPVNAQEKKQETALKREVTLYNPYKPSLREVRKRSFLPDLNDTLKVKQVFYYSVNAEPFMPAYIISPIKAASLLPDPLPKLYKSYVNLGFGNYITPLAEISITNERSKKGAIGFYGRHFSTNGKVELQNGRKVFAGYMDNDASIFGRKFFRNNLLEGSVDFSQKTRYAYGYDTSVVNYSPTKKDIRLNYDNIGINGSFSSLTLDSTDLAYDFDVSYNFFYNAKNMYQHNFGIEGFMAKSYKDFYVGSGIGYDYYQTSDQILTDPKYIASLSPFVRKSTRQWNFKLGLMALLDRNQTESAEFHVYPDINFGFSVIPSYLSFFTGLSGKMEVNDPLKIICENPFLSNDGSLFTLPDTDHKLIVLAGLKGNTGLNGNYLVSASYSILNDILFYTNLDFTENFIDPTYGNYFLPLSDDGELLNLHGELSGAISEKLSFRGVANYYKYTLSNNAFPWGKPDWDGNLEFKYNLKDKIIAGAELTVLGRRKLIVTSTDPFYFESSAYFNLNLSAEYRYSKILSFWTKFNNISSKRYYEWAFYPSQRFLCMLGFTYSL